jgi:hypothetical protein
MSTIDLPAARTGSDRLLDRRNLLLAGTTLAAASAFGSASPIQTALAQTAGSKPNVLFIMGDDIGWFNVSAYNMGIMGYRTPHIDRIGKEGAVFTDWYGQQSCTAGRAAFLTGQSPIRTGLTKVGLPGAALGLGPDDPSVADVMKSLGYATGQFGKNHLGDRNEHLPTVHGFDEFFGNLYHLNAEEEPENPDYPKVDGAYGALAAIAAPEKLRGLSLADSVSLDAHKWLYQPVDCGCLLHRHSEVARKTFSNTDDYVRILNEDPLEAFAFFEESFELTRRFRALKLWMSLQYHGRRTFRDAITRDLDHAQKLAQAIRSQPELELMGPVPLSAVCFRHRAKDNEAILRRVIARGRVLLSNATIGGHFALRACFVNHRTRSEDVNLIVSEVIAAANDLNQSKQGAPAAMLRHFVRRLW